MIGSTGSGIELLKKQRQERNQRLAGLTMSDYFQAMETIRQGGPISPNIKRYLLSSYNSNSH